MYGRRVEQRKHRALLWAAGIAAALVLAGALVLLTLAVELSGGWDDALDLSNPEPGDSAVVAARQSAAATVDAEITRISGQVVQPAMTDVRVAVPAVTGPPAVPGTSDGYGADPATGSYCGIGQHNWKRDDPYDLACREIRREVLAGSTEALATDLPAVHDALVADGYAPVGDGLREIPGPAQGQATPGDRSSPSPDPSVSAWYATGDLTLHVATRVDGIAADQQPNLAADEYGLLVEVTLASYHD